MPSTKALLRQLPQEVRGPMQRLVRQLEDRIDELENQISDLQSDVDSLRR